MPTWIPRVLAIVYIAFISLFALDVFGGDHGFWGTMLALFMHLLPSFVLIAILIFAWNDPVRGGTLFVLLGTFFTLMYLKSPMPIYALIISLPVIMIGGLFLLSWTAKRD